MSSIQLYDTTLRDGAQREGISFSAIDKLDIARKLDEIGIHYIEGGWPGSNPKDVEFFNKAQSLALQHALLVSFGSSNSILMRAKILCLSGFYFHEDDGSVLLCNNIYLTQLALVVALDDFVPLALEELRGQLLALISHLFSRIKHLLSTYPVPYRLP